LGKDSFHEQIVELNNIQRGRKKRQRLFVKTKNDSKPHALQLFLMISMEERITSTTCKNVKFM
jgi:hypothetical protein